MNSVNGKGIEIFLVDGSLDGRITVSDDDWKGRILVSPKDKLNEFFKQEELSWAGIYCLISDTKVYVGQSNDLKNRLANHIDAKPWWDRVVVLTPDNNSFGSTELDYLESELIKKSQNIGTLDSDNKNCGNKVNITEMTKNRLDKYLKEALFLLQLIGVRVFEKKAKNQTIVVAPSSENEVLTVGSKKDAFAIIDKAFGLRFATKNRHYAKLSKDKANYWLNPKKNCVNERWVIALNDWIKKEVIVIDIPKNKMQILHENQDGYLRVRRDNTSVLEIKISCKDLCDLVTKTPFGPYVVERISYGNHNGKTS